MFFTKALQMDGTLGMYAPIEDGSGINWNSIINQGFALGSQMVNAWSGQNTGTQFAQGSGGIFAITNQQPTQTYSNPYAGMTAEQIAALANANKRPGSLGGTLDGVLEFLTSPIGLFVVVGGVLLFMKPPGRK